MTAVSQQFGPNNRLRTMIVAWGGHGAIGRLFVGCRSIHGELPNILFGMEDNNIYFRWKQTEQASRGTEAYGYAESRDLNL